MSKLDRYLLVLLYLLFFLVGITTVLVGQVLPFLSKRLSLTDAESGQFFAAHFAGSITGIFLYEALVKRKGFLSVILLGCLSAAVGVLLVNSDSQLICSLGFLLNGIGTGANIPSANMLLAEMKPAKAASALSFLNFFWGVGAIVSQPFFFSLADGNDLLLPTVLLSVAYFLIFVSLLFVSLQKTDKTSSVSLRFNDIWKKPVAWLIAFFNFAHVGLESGIGGWLTTYSARLYGDFISATPFFFTFFVLGRLIAPLFLRHVSSNLFILASLVVLLVGLLLVTASNGYFILILGASVCGIGTSAIFPLNMARFTEIFSSEAAKNAMPLFVMGSIGGATTTWLIGFLSDYFGSLHAGIFVLLINVCSLILIQLLILASLNRVRK